MNRAQGQVTLDGTPLDIVSWTTDTIVVNAPTRNTGLNGGELLVTNGAGVASEIGITLTVSGVGEGRILRVPAEYPTIQAALDDVNPNGSDIVLVSPGAYNERVIMWKPTRLQGSGASTLINGVINPMQSLVAWREKVDCLFGITAGCTKVVDELPGQGPGSEGLLSSEGATVSVFAPYDPGAAGVRPDNRFAGRNARIDGFSITGSSTAGGVFVNGWAHGLDITNNDVFGNSGGLHGGIRVGEPDLQQASPSGIRNNRRYDFNRNVHIAYNIVRQNGSVGVAGAGGVGGGVSIMAGSDGYQVTDNFICGNFTLGDGAGVGHFGLSQNGLIARNDIVLNQSFEQTVNVSGGGIYVGGEVASVPLPSGELITPGAGRVTIQDNLIQANQAGAGHGGGIRLQNVNGADVVGARNGNNGADNDLDGIVISNNKIVNNIAGWSGAGISMVDAIKVELTDNTIAHNDTTATVGSLISVVGGVNSSVAQPAGVVAEMNSALLQAAINTKNNSSSWLPYKNNPFSNATISGGQIWQNRSFTYYADAATSPRLLPELTQTAVGDCDTGAAYWDLAVLNTANVLTTSGTVLTGAADPFVDAYCNGGRAAPGPIDVFPAVDEAGAAWIDVRFGPLSVFGDYSTP